MGGIAMTYLLPCCGRRSYTAPVSGHPCFDCAMASTAPNDPIAVAYRARLAALVPDTPTREVDNG